MDITGYIENIALSADSFVTVRLSAGASEDSAQLMTMNESSAMFFACMRDRTSPGSLLYDCSGYIPLDKYLLSTSFTCTGLWEFMLNIAGLEQSITSASLQLSNVVFRPQYVFINPYSQHVRFIYIPIAARTTSAELSYKSLIKYVITNASVENAQELYAFVLAGVNSPAFDAVRFYNELRQFSPKTPRQLVHRGRIRVLVTVLLTLLLTGGASLGIPLAADYFDYTLLEQYISDDALRLFSLLFALGGGASLVIGLIIAFSLSSRSPRAKAMPRNLAQPARMPAPMAWTQPPVAPSAERPGAVTEVKPEQRQEAITFGSGR